MNALNFGTAVRDITPAHPVWAQGYASRTRKASGVLERLSLGYLDGLEPHTRTFFQRFKNRFEAYWKRESV